MRRCKVLGRTREAFHRLDDRAQPGLIIEAQIQHLVDTAVSTFGGVDILHNNAALLSPDVIARDTQITDIDPALFERVLRVNVIGYTLTAKHVIPQMIRRGGGVIINTSSAAGVLGELIRPMHGTSKAAIIGPHRRHPTAGSATTGSTNQEP